MNTFFAVSREHDLGSVPDEHIKASCILGVGSRVQHLRMF